VLYYNIVYLLNARNTLTLLDSSTINRQLKIKKSCGSANAIVALAVLSYGILGLLVGVLLSFKYWSIVVALYL
jgi:hypothetical protein